MGNTLTLDDMKHNCKSIARKLGASEEVLGNIMNANSKDEVHKIMKKDVYKHND